MALPVNGSTHLIPAYYSFIDPERMKGSSWPSWLTCSGWFTHISGHPSAAGRAQDRESSPVRDRRSTNCATPSTILLNNKEYLPEKKQRNSMYMTLINNMAKQPPDETQLCSQYTLFRFIEAGTLHVVYFCLLVKLYRTLPCNLIYNLIRSKFLRQKLKNGFTADDERWHIHSVTPTDENRLCPMSICALCKKLRN